jgi:23S rRNA (cytosine1962-C5)-methyltransferase
MVDYLSDRLEIPLFIVHRLDKDTAGIMVVATSKDSASRLSQQFIGGDVKKYYEGVSRGIGQSAHFTVDSPIRSKKGLQGARSSFDRLELDRDTNQARWKIGILSGRTHQVRIHAHHRDIPLLGDTLYEPSSKVPLHLHAVHLTIGGGSYTSSPPSWFEAARGFDCSSLKDSLSLSLERRTRLFLWNSNEAFRMTAHEIGDVTIDKLGDVLWCSWYRALPPSFSDIQELKRLSEELCCRGILLREMKNRGKDTNVRHRAVHPSFTPPPPSWIVEEDGLQLLCKSGQGLSSGIFVDQRANRRWIRRTASGKRILNLFSYSGAFTVAALSADASQVVSVDTSKQAHEWAKENLSVNSLSMKNSIFLHEDVREYLSRALKRLEVFDCIVLDPPSFARSKRGVFQIEKDWASLVKRCWLLLAPSGTLLFSTNYEQFNPAFLEKELESLLPDAALSFHLSDPDCTLGAHPGIFLLITVRARRRE